jgi:hypothetical protein|tara:strand:- start:1609 stop:2217 length:609 start_codon:yes stop_codon:yes gene_type:complete
MTRQEIINGLIEKNSYSSYLEVGVQNPQSCFLRIKCNYKQGVEPYPKIGEFDFPSEVHVITSDVYFESISKDETFDIIFIDGLHHDDQVIKDIENSLKILNTGGTIVVHDCLPTTEKQQERDDHGGVWLGDVWKGIAYLRINRSDIQIEVVDTDLGCGVITKKDSKKWDTNGEEWNVYGYYQSNKTELMNIISTEDFKQKYF